MFRIVLAEEKIEEFRKAAESDATIEIPKVSEKTLYLLTKDYTHAYIQTDDPGVMLGAFREFTFRGKDIGDVFGEDPDRVLGIAKVSSEGVFWCVRKQYKTNRITKFHGGIFDTKEFSGDVYIPDYMFEARDKAIEQGHKKVRLHYYNHGTNVELVYDVMEKDLDLLSRAEYLMSHWFSYDREFEEIKKKRIKYCGAWYDDEQDSRRY